MARRFARWARSEGLTARTLLKAAAEVTEGRFDADLGGFLFKKRVPRTGGGKRGGFRTIIGYRRGNTDRVVFVYGFAKNVASNVSDRELGALAMAAADFIDADDARVHVLTTDGDFTELEPIQ